MMGVGRFGDTSYQACAKIEGVRYDRMTFGLGFFMYDLSCYSCLWRSHMIALCQVELYVCGL